MADATLAIVTSTPCTGTRDCTILANLAWLDAHGWQLDTNRESFLNDEGDGFAVGLLGEAGLTPATRAA